MLTPTPPSEQRLLELARALPLKRGEPKKGESELEGLTREARAERRRLRGQLAEADFKDARLQNQLVPFNVFETALSKAREAQRLTTAKASVQALAGASFGPLGLVAAYQAYANLPKAGLKDLVEGMQAPGQLSFSGNRVEQVHQQELWRSMRGLLQEGVDSAKAGKKVEVNAQFYELTSQEMVHKLVENAAAGNKVRLNLDPGQLVPYNPKDALNADDIPDKMRAMLQLMDAPGDVALSLYPRQKLLGSATDLMHRKGLRVGDKFLLGGMNLNNGSGENVDAGYITEGPAARALGHTFARDCQQSQAASLEDLYGAKALDELMQRDVKLGRRGLMSLVDALDGPSPPGANLPRPKSQEDLKRYVSERGFKLEKFVEELPSDREVEENRPVLLSEYGKRRLLDLVKLVHREVHSPENQAKVADVQLPSDAPKGTTVVSLADTPTQRETLLLNTIHEADKFIYMPAFVITRPVAAALVAKANEMKAQGKPFDVRVLADPGIYPDGSTPNSWGVKFLEDHDIPVRWALLPRTGTHDRKIHAKELLTDKSDFVGSTNFSAKGLRHNHEHSGAIHFEGQSELAEQAKSAFEDLWDNHSLKADTRSLSERWKRGYAEADRENQIDQARSGAVRHIIRAVADYEKESAGWVAAQATHPEVEKLAHQLLSQGYDHGNATLMAVRQHLGQDKFLAGLANLKSRQPLNKLSSESLH